jgi:hypothetical protein
MHGLKRLKTGVNSHLHRDALETAAIYARSHPLVGRPGGTPWSNAA